MAIRITVWYRDFFRIRHYWDILWKVVNAYKSDAASSHSFILIARWRQWLLHFRVDLEPIRQMARLISRHW